MSRVPRLLAALGAVVVVAGCDIIIVVLAILFIGPLYPGRPQPPAPPPECPLIVPEQTDTAALPTLPDDLRKDVVTSVCAVPEKPMLARLNRGELERSLQALTGHTPNVKEVLPPDTTGGGLDTIAALHGVSPLLVEQLELAAHAAVARGMRRQGESPEAVRIEAELVGGDIDDGSGFVRLSGGRTVSSPVFLPVAGTWAIRVRAAPVPAGPTAPRVIVRLDGQELFTASLDGEAGVPVVVEGRHVLTATADGAVQPVHRVEVALDNPFDRDDRVRGIDLDSIEVEGPFDPPTLGSGGESRALLVPCDLVVEGDTCGKSALSHFAHRAWRGQVTRDDEARLHALYDGERAFDDVETSLRTSMAAVLLSPRFLFRLELDPRIADTADEVTPGVRHLTDHELAARLAAFLWSSAPDDRLLELAHLGALRDARVLEGEARRMLNDPRSTAIIERFFAMWLDLEALDHARPDADRFETFDEGLRTSMRCETELLVDRVFREGGTLTDLLLTEQKHTNHALAAHYGLPPPDLTNGAARDGYVETDLTGLGRPGLLTTSAVLTLTSQPTRTSPTRRGAWVLERLMCTTPPPPPPGVEGLVEVEPAEQQQSVRAQLEAHRQDPACAQCHDFIDPMGLPLERFDAIGRRRGTDGAFAIDDSALWFGIEGEEVRGAHELAQRLADDSVTEACLAQRAVSYATGVLIGDQSSEDPAAVDVCSADEIATRAAARGGALSDIVMEVVMSPAFRARRAIAIDESPLPPTEESAP